MKKFLTVVFVMLLSGIVFCSRPVLAEMTPKEILEKSDEAPD
jgi:hypothetical protein